MATESNPSCVSEFEQMFELLIGEPVSVPDGDFEQIVRDMSTEVIKTMLSEAVRTVRDYALPVRDRESEAAIHGEINFMLDELDFRSSVVALSH